MVEERTVLSKLGDFYGYTNPSPNQWYSFMRFYDGVQIWKSDGWKQYVSASGGFYRDLGKDQNQCTQFFLNYFKDVSSKAAAMAVQVGQIHEDVHAGNVLIPQAYPSKQEPVNIIDWEMINPTDPNATTQQNYQTAYNVAYERLSTTLPYQQMCSGESGVFADVDKSVAWKWAGQLTTDETSTSGINGP
ncbi:hypothetical protein FRB99_004327 [Tulasnella sp. 403]|nr:hypothetical protein FRB99_004327 [Tulasnella sp. 403]